MYDVARLPVDAAGKTIPDRTPIVFVLIAAVLAVALLATASVTFFVRWG